MKAIFVNKVKAEEDKKKYLSHVWLELFTFIYALPDSVEKFY